MAKRDEQRKAFPFTEKNYYLLLAAVGIITLGFLLMIGGSDGDPNKFNGEELFSFRRITLAPLTVLFGYAMVMVAIMYRPKGERGSETKEGEGTEDSEQEES